MAYNMTPITEANGLVETLIAVDTAVDHWFFRLVLLSLFLLIFISGVRVSGEPLKWYISASFVTALVAALMYGVGMVGYYEPLLSAIMFGSGLVILWGGGVD